MFRPRLQYARFPSCERYVYPRGADRSSPFPRIWPEQLLARGVLRQFQSRLKRWYFQFFGPNFCAYQPRVAGYKVAQSVEALRSRLLSTATDAIPTTTIDGAVHMIAISFARRIHFEVTASMSRQWASLSLIISKPQP